MLVEFSIIPVGSDEHISGAIAEALKIVDASGIPYQLTPTATCIEGDWDTVMGVIRQCHERVREGSEHVVTMIKIEDEAGATNKLTENVLSVERKVGHALRHG